MSLMQEMVRGGLYKRTQGRITRQVTFAAVCIAIALGCWQLSASYTPPAGQTATDQGAQVQRMLFKYLIPGTLALLGGWFSYRLVNYPRFADFLIAVEAEMAKVNWPSRKELFRASAVVLVTMAVLAVVLYLYDMGWWFLLYDVMNISNKKPPSL